MAQKAETRITNAIIESIAESFGDAFHVHGSMFQRKGEPDICGEVVFHGRMYHLKVEVKTTAKTSKPDPLQIYRLQIYHRRDYVAGVVRSVDEFWELVRLHHSYLHEHTQVSFKEFIGDDPYDLYDSTHQWGSYSMASLIETEINRQLEKVVEIKDPLGAGTYQLVETQRQRDAALADIIRNMSRALLMAEKLIEDPQQRIFVYAALLPKDEAALALAKISEDERKLLDNGD